MLLQRLVAYAGALSDAAPPYYSEKEVRWMLRLERDGTPSTGSLIPLRDPSDPKGRRGVRRLVPDLVRPGTKSKPCLAADQIKYVLGWIRPDDVDPVQTERVTGRHHAAFRELIAAWQATYPGEAVAKAIHHFYQDGHSERMRPADDAWADNDLAVFSVDGMFAPDLPTARQFWLEHCQRMKVSANRGVCLCCGEVRALLPRMTEQIKGKLLPGGGSQGQALVSMNHPPHGFDLVQGLTNTPICEACGNSAMTGLDALLRDRSRSLGRRGQAAKTVWWLAGKSVETSLFDLIESPDEDQVAALIGSIATGREPSVSALDAAAFCSLTLSGSTARVIVRDWVDLPLERVMRNVASWFADHAMADLATGQVRHFGVGYLALVMGRYKSGRAQGDGSYADFGDKGDQRPGDAYEALVRAATRADPLPVSLLGHVVRRVRMDHRLDTARAALIRLGLIRYQKGETVTAALDPDARDPAYVCGRVFTVLEAIQYATTKGGDQRNTTFVDRYLSKAIANPAAALVAGRKDSIPWLRKLRLSQPGPQVALGRRLDELFDLLTEIPVALTLTEQARFLLGYHHQRAYDRASAIAAKAAKAAKSQEHDTVLPA